METGTREHQEQNSLGSTIGVTRRMHFRCVEAAGQILVRIHPNLEDLVPEIN
jgi:hypothetical protein